MTEQLHPDLARLQQQYMQLFQAVTDQTMSVDQAMATLQALKAIDGAGYEWSYTPNGQLVRAIPGQPGQPTEPWEFTPPQLPPHASDPGLTQFGGGQFAPPAGFGGGQFAPQQGNPANFGGYPQQAPGQAGGGYSPLSGPPARSLPSTLPGQTGAKNPKATQLLGMLRANGKLLGVGAVCVVLLLVGLNTLRGGDSGPTVADAVPTPPPAPIEVPILPAPTLPGDGGGDTGGEPSEDAEAEETQPSVPDGDRVLEVLGALRSGDADRVASVVAEPGTTLQVRLLAAQLSGFATVGLELVADPAAESGDGQATQNWRVVDRDTAETLNTVTVTWVLREGRWLVTAVPPLG
jgi:hypothetical protein